MKIQNFKIKNPLICMYLQFPINTTMINNAIVACFILLRVQIPYIQSPSLHVIQAKTVPIIFLMNSQHSFINTVE